MNNAITLILCLVAAVLLSACSARKKAAGDGRQQDFTYNYCNPTVIYLQSPTLWADSPGVDLSHTTIPEHDRLLCHLLGLSSEADSLWRISHREIPYRANEYLLLKQRVTGRLLIAQSQVQAVAAELDCEGERASLAASYLDNINNRRKNNLTVASVVAGALTTVGTVLVSHKTPVTAIGISGGALSALLGVLTINPKGKKLLFYHQRNLLRSIWTDTAANADYPWFVWRLLHEKKLSNRGDITLAQSIRSRWLQYEFDGKVTPGQEALFFGPGGRYRADDLHTRAAMINQLQATIRSLYQDLTGFIALAEYQKVDGTSIKM